MKDNTRRGFMATTASVFLAGCQSNNSTDSASPENQTDGTNLADADTQLKTDEETEDKSNEVYNSLELDGLAERLEESLEMEGYEPPAHQSMARTRFDEDESGHDSIHLDLDLNSILDLAIRQDNIDRIDFNQDIYLLSQTDNLSVLGEDIEQRAYEIFETVEEEVSSFLKQRDIPKNKDLSLDIEVEGYRDSGASLYTSRFDSSQDFNLDANRAVKQLQEEWSQTGPEEHLGSLTHSPGEYEELTHIPESDSGTYEVGSEDYSIEVVEARDNSAVIKISGELEDLDQSEYSDQNERIQLHDSNPMYMEDSVELRVEGEEVQYID